MHSPRDRGRLVPRGTSRVALHCLLVHCEVLIVPGSALYGPPSYLDYATARLVSARGDPGAPRKIKQGNGLLGCYPLQPISVSLHRERGPGLERTKVIPYVHRRQGFPEYEDVLFLEEP